jgi:CDP-diacylglycerol--glycerol-3-phosphate 3-phosphatidyltransferase
MSAAPHLSPDTRLLRLLRLTPLLLTLLRALLAPVMLAIALTSAASATSAAFAACLVAAFLSDVFDGKIARRLGVATSGLRRLDSIADTVFYVAAAACAWLLHPQAIVSHRGALIALLLLELGRYAFDLHKFGKEASYHMWSSKLWGIFLFLGFFSLLVAGRDGILVSLAIYLGLLADIEGLAISLVLPYWINDVPTLFHALAIRRRAVSTNPLDPDVT